jgi:hypothetical protein
MANITSFFCELFLGKLKWNSEINRSFSYADTRISQGIIRYLAHTGMVGAVMARLSLPSMLKRKFSRIPRTESRKVIKGMRRCSCLGDIKFIFESAFSPPTITSEPSNPIASFFGWLRMKSTEMNGCEAIHANTKQLVLLEILLYDFQLHIEDLILN